LKTNTFLQGLSEISPGEQIYQTVSYLGEEVLRQENPTAHENRCYGEAIAEIRLSLLGRPNLHQGRVGLNKWMRIQQKKKV
jgi:hypothetical protein